jgi:hypothetical protein
MSEEVITSLIVYCFLSGFVFATVLYFFGSVPMLIYSMMK